MVDFLFFFFSALAVVSAVFVVTRRNPVASAMFLVVTLFSIAGLFVLLDAHFVAAVQVIVYAGAIMVLFLFVIMLLNVGSLELTEFRGPFARMLGGTFALAVVAFLARPLLGGVVSAPTVARDSSPVLASLEAEGAIGAVAYPLFETYLVPFEVTSLLLLVAIVGAVVLTGRTSS